jgi:hypothetical protein
MVQRTDHYWRRRALLLSRDLASWMRAEEGDRWTALHYLDLSVDIGASASTGAGVATGFLDEIYRTEEFALKGEATARGLRFFLDFAAKYFSTSAFLMRVTASPNRLFVWLKVIVWSEQRELKAKEKTAISTIRSWGLECRELFDSGSTFALVFPIADASNGVI